ncbi:aquaporin [Rhodotorula toruloides]|uniref:Aquaporin n=1 Tax=Rhodotorula toruloides TaxID=5286 RepID=A0A511KEV5_RHOTO|nr:aquaporin [Rhodotorula toruloides]
MSSRNSHLPLHADPNAPANRPHRRSRFKLFDVRPPAQGSPRFAAKNHLIATIGEFVGTFTFLFFALGATNVANTLATSVTGTARAGQGGYPAAAANTSSLLYISCAFGLSLLVSVWIFFKVSGGLYNPAVSLGMGLIGAITWLRVALLVAAQLLGAIAAAAVINALVPGPLNAQTRLAPGMSIARGLFLEMFLTALLCLAIFFLAAEKHRGTFMAPVGIGLALWTTQMLGVYYTGASVNPARSFGPDVAVASFPGYHYIYWIGPALGALLAALFYKLIKWLEYESVMGPDHPDYATARATSTMGTTHVQGPGMGDYLTRQQKRGTAGEGEGTVYSPPGSPTSPTKTVSSFHDRFDRLEAMVEQLIRERGGGEERLGGNGGSGQRIA